MEQIICPLYEHAHATPHKPALITDERTWSYSELDEAVHALCHFLRETGVKKQQRVAFVAHTEVPTLLLFFALFRLGAIACPLSFRLPEEQISAALKQLKVASLLCPHALCLRGKKGSFTPHSISLHSPATLLFTSGSTGTPKIACHTLGNHYYSALGAVQALRVDSSSRWLLSLPLFHVGGIAILFRCFQQGASVALSKKPLEQALFEHEITHASLVPTQLYRLLQREDRQLSSSLKCLVLGGAPVPPTLLERALREDLPVYTTYGMTEMSSMVTLCEAKPGTHVGKALPFRELKIDGESEIWVRGETLFMGYWDPVTESTAGADGWFPTKDRGRWTPEGNLEVLGRTDRLFISGGENIQPEEIERALCAIAGIGQATVLPVPDPEFGHRPVAFIEDETGAHTLESIRAALRASLPSFMHPIRLLPYGEIPGIKPNLAALKQQLT
jgi:O-succinylbenzoic acid--CoA ligase